jgi:hypothetical protein
VIACPRDGQSRSGSIQDHDRPAYFIVSHEAFAISTPVVISSWNKGEAGFGDAVATLANSVEDQLERWPGFVESAIRQPTGECPLVVVSAFSDVIFLQQAR